MNNLFFIEGVTERMWNIETGSFEHNLDLKFFG